MRRSSPAAVRFGTWNLAGLGSGADTGYQRVTEVIRSLDADVLAIQGLAGREPERVLRLLTQLGADTGMSSWDGDGDRADPASLALTFGGHGSHVALLWRDGIDPVPGSVSRWGGPDFWHGLVMASLDVGGVLVRHVSFHAAPVGRGPRASQNELLAAVVTRDDENGPALAGADWDTECADRVPDDDGQWRLYEPADPFAPVPWFGELIHQCRWESDESGRRHWADREPGEVLWAAGLTDAAASLRSPWQPSTGHHPGDVYARHGVSRRPDAVRVTEPVRPALRAHQVVSTPQAQEVSPHLPVLVEYLPAAIG